VRRAATWLEACVLASSPTISFCLFPPHPACTRVPRLLDPSCAKNPSVPSRLSQAHCFHEKNR